MVEGLVVAQEPPLHREDHVGVDGGGQGEEDQGEHDLAASLPHGMRQMEMATQVIARLVFNMECFCVEFLVLWHVDLPEDEGDEHEAHEEVGQAQGEVDAV